jgi:hypothetical protein
VKTRKLLWAGCTLATLIFFPGWLRCEDAAASEPAAPASQPSSLFRSEALDPASLRNFHEGAIFVLRRYATLEALITAVDKGRSENQAFLIGASSLVPGVGQFINQDNLQGGLLLFASGISWGTLGHLGPAHRSRRGQASAEAVHYAAMIARNGIMTYSMLHAANACYRARRDRTAAMWTGTASLLPGAGQAINGNWWEAGGFAAAWALTAWASSSIEPPFEIRGDERSAGRQDSASPVWNLAWLPGGAALQVAWDW